MIGADISVGDLSAILLETLLTSFTIGLVIVAIGIGLSLLLIGKAMQPVHCMALAVRDAAQTKDFSRPFPQPGGRNVLSQMSISLHALFNTMGVLVRETKAMAKECAGMAMHLNRAANEIQQNAVEESKMVCAATQTGDDVKTALMHLASNASRTRERIISGNVALIQSQK